MIKEKGYDTLIASDLDYEKLVCEIYYDGLFLALISQERGEGLFDFETPGPNVVETGVTRKADLKGFQEAIETACRRLKGEEP